MLTTIKQWFYQKVAKHLLRGVTIKQMDAKGYEPGFLLLGKGWVYVVPNKRIPRLAEKPYVSKYDLRTRAEHDAIRKRIQVDPADCRHLKGRRFINDTRVLIKKDYNISCFTFVDGSQQIKCLSCRHVWTKDSPDWSEAARMVQNSTNTPNACEVPIKITPLASLNH